jgi:hypothetical protein
MSTDFGNTFVHVRRISISGLILSSIVGIIFICVGYTHGTLSEYWPEIAIFTLAMTAVLPLIVLLTSLFSIRLDERYVTHLFLGRVVLSQHPLSDLVAAEFFRRSFFPVVFRFSNGSSIRFMGAHLAVISDMRDRLFELRPDLALCDD